MHHKYRIEQDAPTRLTAYRIPKKREMNFTSFPVLYQVTTGFEPVVRELQSLEIPFNFLDISTKNASLVKERIQFVTYLLLYLILQWF